LGKRVLARIEPGPNLSPEQVYDRRWAATLLDLAFRRLREDFKAAEQLDRFELLKSFLSGDAAKGDADGKRQFWERLWLGSSGGGEGSMTSEEG